MPFSSYAKGQTELLTLADRIGEEIADNYRQQQATEALNEYRREQLANRQDNTAIRQENTAIRRADLNRRIDADAAKNQYNYLRALGGTGAGNSTPRTTSLPGGIVPTYVPASQRQLPKRTDNYVPFGTQEDNALFAATKRGNLTAEQNKILSERLGKFVKVPTSTQYDTVLTEDGIKLLRDNGRDPSKRSEDEKIAALTDISHSKAVDIAYEKAEQDWHNRQEEINRKNEQGNHDAEAHYQASRIPDDERKRFRPIGGVSLGRILDDLDTQKRLNKPYDKDLYANLKRFSDEIDWLDKQSGHYMSSFVKGNPNDVYIMKVGNGFPDVKTTIGRYNKSIEDNLKEIDEKRAKTIAEAQKYYDDYLRAKYKYTSLPDAEFVPPTDAEITAQRIENDGKMPNYYRIEKKDVVRDKNSPHHRLYAAKKEAYDNGDYNKLISLMTPEERKAAGIDVRAVNNYIKREDLTNKSLQMMNYSPNTNGASASGDNKEENEAKEIAKEAVDMHEQTGLPLETTTQIVAAQYNKNKELEKEKQNKEIKENFGNPPEGVIPAQHALAAKRFGAQYGNATDAQKKAFVYMLTAYLEREEAVMAEKDPVKKLKMLRKMDEDWRLEAQTEKIKLPYLVSPWRYDIYQREHALTLQERDKFDNENKVERGYADWLKTDEPLHEYAKRFGVNNIGPNFSYKDYKTPNVAATQIKSANKTMYPDIIEAAHQAGNIGYQPGQVPTVHNPAMISKYDVALNNAKRTGNRDAVIFLTKILPAIVKRWEYNKALSDREKWMNELDLEYEVKVPTVEK